MESTLSNASERMRIVAHHLVQHVRNLFRIFILKPLPQKILNRLQCVYATVHKKTLEVCKRMIGPMEKGIAAAQMTAPPEGTYDGIDLRILPKYICFKAALLQNKITYQRLSLALACFLVVHFVMSRHEVAGLYDKLRTKEYILAPGVQDFTTALPQNVTDDYVISAVQDFINQMGNVTPGNIENQFSSLAESMSPQLKIRFAAESSAWVDKVKADSISELVTITDREVRTKDGAYEATAFVRRDTYLNNEYAGHTDEVVEMGLQLVPPKSGRRWYLQINSLSRQSADSFRKKKGF